MIFRSIYLILIIESYNFFKLVSISSLIINQDGQFEFYFKGDRSR